MTKTLLPSLVVCGLGGCLAPDPEPAPMTTGEIARAVCPSAQLFDHAVCVCEDFDQVGRLVVRPGPAGTGSVGVNGRTDLVTHADVAGSWHAWGGFSSVGVAIGESLITPGDVSFVGDVEIGKDAIIGGDLSAVGRLLVAGNLALAGGDSIIGDSTIGARTPYVAPSGPPCGCEGERLFDVAKAVRAARQATNGETSWEKVGTNELRLATGSYYATLAELIGESTIAIDGNVSIFVEGSLTSVGSTQWKLGPNATLDLFVSGNVAHVGDLIAGDPARADAFRLYVGGDGDTAIDVVGDAAFFGSLYAPRARVRHVGTAKLVGSVVARSLDAVGTLEVAYGEPLTPPSSCDEPPGGPIL